MKAQELRIGNLVNLPVFSDDPSKFTEKICADYGYAIVRLNSVLIRDAEHYKENWAGKPIPLSKKLLAQFGIDLENRPEWLDLLNDYSIECDGTSYRKGAYPKIKIQFLHEFQNLMFVLTGEELTDSSASVRNDG